MKIIREKLSLKRIIRSFLWRSRIGRYIAEKFWKKVSNGKGLRYLYYNEAEIFADIPSEFPDPVISAFIKQDSKRWSKQNEFILEIENALVEPERCLAIRNWNELIDQSVVTKFDYQFPYILPYLINRKKTVQIDQAVLYDGSATRNYYHHFVNALNSLYIHFSKQMLPADIPFIISRKMFNQPFFQFIYQRSEELRRLNWHIQEEGEWLKVKKLYKLQCLHFDPKPWQWCRKLYQLDVVRPYRKVFINRDKRRFGRYLQNEQEIVSLLQRYGFEMRFMEDMGIEEQARLFQEAKYVVALTGMALIQQFFMNYDEAHVIEIMPNNRLMPEYYWQANTMGISYYDIIVGGDMVKGKAYTLDPLVLENAIKRMFSANRQKVA